MGKQRRLVRQQLIEAAIQRVLGDQPIILAQQIRHRALLEPLPMQAPLAAGIDQPIAHQRLQDVLPAGAFARIRQQRCKEPIQLQLLIEMTGQPACSPLARAMQLHRIEPHLYPKALGMIRHPLLGRKQGKLPMPPAPLVDPLDHPAPRRVLTVVDLAQIQNRTLHHPTARTAPAFDNAPIPVLLAVLPSPCESQVHGPRFYAQTKIRKERRSSLHAFSPHRPLRRFSFFRQNSKIRGPVGKVGLAACQSCWHRGSKPEFYEIPVIFPGNTRVLRSFEPKPAWRLRLPPGAAPRRDGARRRHPLSWWNAAPTHGSPRPSCRTITRCWGKKSGKPKTIPPGSASSFARPRALPSNDT